MLPLLAQLGGITPRQSVANIEKQLTPQEMEIVKYHRNSLSTGKVGRDPEGRPVTVFSMGPKIRKGKYAGKFASVPGFVNGKILSEDQALDYWMNEIEQGKWPIYNSGDELNKRSQFLHGIMDMESQ